MTLEVDYSLEDVAKATGMSTRWIRDRCKDGAEHIRYGHKIRFTQAMVEKLRADHTKTPSAEPITTGRKKSRA